MSNYGTSAESLYNEADNVRRKANNTGETNEWSQHNTNVKSYSSKPGQLTSKQQAYRIAKDAIDKSAQNPVNSSYDLKRKVAEEMGIPVTEDLKAVVPVPAPQIMTSLPSTLGDVSTLDLINELVERKRVEFATELEEYRLLLMRSL